jgi:hypothetical protein
MYCHGFLASYVFDNTDDISAVRSGRKGRKDAQKRWVAHLLDRLLKSGVSREDAEDIIGRYVADLRERKRYPPGFGERWYQKMADKFGRLAATYDADHFWPGMISDRLAEGDDGLPPIPTLDELAAFSRTE